MSQQRQRVDILSNQYPNPRKQFLPEQFIQNPKPILVICNTKWLRLLKCKERERYLNEYKCHILSNALVILS